MNDIVQLATILSPIIAVGLAWWTVRSSSRDTNKKIAAIEDSTAKQIKTVKKLTRLQLELSTMQINKELWESRYRHHQTTQKQSSNDGIGAAMRAQLPPSMQDEIRRKEDLSYEEDFLEKQRKVLVSNQKRLSEIQIELEEE